MVTQKGVNKGKPHNSLTASKKQNIIINPKNYFKSKDCPLEFLGYSIRNPETDDIVYQRNKYGVKGKATVIEGIPPEFGIVYILPDRFLGFSIVATQLEFKNITDQPIKDLVVKEEHYLQDKQLQSFEFKLPFVMPNSTNTWENIYEPDFERDFRFINAAKKGPWNIRTQVYVNGDRKLATFARICIQSEQPNN